VDRVARAALYSDAWRKDSFLKHACFRTEVARGPAAVPRKLQDFAAAFARKQASSDARGETAGPAAEEREKRSREAWERHFELRRRATVKLTDTGGAREERKGSRDSKPARGGGGGGKVISSRGFQTPSENRRDDVRWEIRRRMAAPPVL
jgi:hypothetical protein